MWQGRRWAGVALSAAVAAGLCLGSLAPALAGDAGTQVLGWKVSGAIEAGGMGSAGERGSNKFNEYRDMDNGFLGELEMRGEKKESPYYFELGLKNPTRDDQMYGGTFGRYGMFTLDLEWNRTPHVLSNTASTIFQGNNGGGFTLPPTLLPAIRGIFAGGVANRANIQSTIRGLSQPVDLGFNTDVGVVAFKFTPTEFLRFDMEYNNRRVEGTRYASIDMSGSVITELPAPLDQMTHEAKIGLEFARPMYGFQFGYTGSWFDNQVQSYRFDNQAPPANATQERGEFSAPPNNFAHTFNFTGRGSLPWWRTNVSGNFSYTLLRQDETFLTNVAAGLPGATNFDDQGRNSPDAKRNVVAANFLVTSRPLSNVTATARYRFFQYQNDSGTQTFTNTFAPNSTPLVGETIKTAQERFTKQNAGFDIGWRPVKNVSLKGGYEYEHWHRADFDAQADITATEGKNFGTSEHILKASADATPVNWLLGRISYTYGNKNLYDYGKDPLAGNGPQFLKYNYADRVRNRVDTLIQLSRWETFTPSFNFGYTVDNFNKSAYGLTDDQNISAGLSLSWAPLAWLTVSADYTYERHDAHQRIFQGGAAFEANSKDTFHIVGLNTILDVIPKKFDLNLGYGVSFGYTTVHNDNLNPTCAGQACANDFPKIQNVLQTARVVGRYRLTEQLSLRAGFAYERFNEANFARDPMLTYMGFYDSSAASSQSVWLGATTPNYEAYTIAGFVRYEFN